jgi:uncharacterized protein (TIGR02266 family)
MSINGPWIEIEGPWMSINGPWIEIEGPWMSINGPWIEIEGPWVSIDVPFIHIEGPWMSIDVPWIDVEGPRMSIHGPWIEIEGPWMSIDVPRTDIEAPWISIDVPRIEIEGPWMSIHGPRIEIEGPRMSIHGPWIEIDGPRMSIHGPWVEIHGPFMSIRGPLNEIGVPRVSIDGRGRSGFLALRRGLCNTRRGGRGSMDHTDRRAHPRLTLAVDVDFSSGHNFYSARLRDISVGGLFIEAEATLPVGTRLTVDLTFLRKHLRVECEVMWALTDGDRPVGVGVRFLDLSPAARKSVEAFMVLRHPLPAGDVDDDPDSAPKPAPR